LEEDCDAPTFNKAVEESGWFVETFNVDINGTWEGQGYSHYKETEKGRKKREVEYAMFVKAIENMKGRKSKEISEALLNAMKRRKGNGN